MKAFGRAQCNMQCWTVLGGGHQERSGKGARTKEVYNVPHTPYEGYLALGLRVWGMRGYLALELGVWDSWGVDCFWEVPPCYLIWGGYHGEDERREEREETGERRGEERGE